MKRNLKLFLAVGLCVAIFLPNMVTAADYKWPANINVGTSGAGSAHQIITQAWGSLLEAKTGTKFRVVPDPDPPRMIKAMQGKLDFLFMDLGELAFYYKGEGALAALPKENIYGIWMEYDPPMGFMVAGDSELNTIYDIKKAVEQGKRIRVAHFAPAPAWSIRITHLLPAFLGIKPEQLTPVPFGSIPDMYESVLNNKAEVVCPGLSSPMLPELMAKPKGIKFLELPTGDREGWKRALEVLPTEWPGQINTWGVPEVFRGQGCMVAPALYVALGDKDEEFIYNVAKFIHQNYNEYKDAMAQTKRMSLENWRSFLDVSALPVHPGAVRYLKEIGQWTADDDTWNDAAKATMQKYVDAWKELEKQAKAKNINIKSGDKAFQDLWADLTRDITPLKTRY